MRNRLFPSKKALAEALRHPSSWVLIAVNLGLITAVVAWDWQVFDIVFLYWVENLVIGAINVLKMIAASPKPGKSNAIKLFLIPFFIVHYGMFCYGHGIFVFSMFSEQSEGGDSLGITQAWELLNTSMLLAVSLLAASHLFSFFRNFIAGGEYKRTHPSDLMARPYGRIVVLHITIILGAFLTQAFDSPLGLLVILMVLKTLVDLAMHESERKKFQDIHQDRIPGTMEKTL